MNANRYKNYLLLVLLAVLTTNYVDRLALGLVMQEIKVDLALSDTQLGLLSGLAFAVFYSIMGIPIARWADQGNRVAIISITTVLWSAAVALCGMAGNFVQLLLIRVGVAIGEAGCIPPAHSLIADYFSRAERPRAVAIYKMGGALSMVIGYFLAGWLNEYYGWRMTFILLSLPGLALTALVVTTIKEPRRHHSQMSQGYATSIARPVRQTACATAPDKPSLYQICGTLWAIPTFRHLLVCFSIVFFFNYGIGQWQPTFFIRSYGLSTGELGTWLTITYGLCGIVGTYVGGVFASRFAANNERLQLKAMAAAYACFGLTTVFVYISSNHYTAFCLLGMGTLAITATNGPLFATIQTLVPDRMRAVSIAIIYLFANLIGMGLGPLAAGMLSDQLQTWAGDDSLRYALLALSPGYLWGAWHAWQGSRSVAADLAVAVEHRHSSSMSPLEQHGSYVNRTI